MDEVKFQGSTFKPFKFMEVKASMHKRSKSDPPKCKIGEDKFSNIFEASPRLKSKYMTEQDSSCYESKKRQSPKAKVQHSLKQEILQLHQRLRDQFMVRQVLEKGDYSSSTHNATNENPTLKPARDLIKEIAVLEMQVVYLEQYLLSLYRKRFNQVSPSSDMDQGLKSTSFICKEKLSEILGQDTKSEKYPVFRPRENSFQNPPEEESSHIWEGQKLTDSAIHRSQSSLSQRSIRAPHMGVVAEAVNSYHSLPLSMLERAQDETRSLAEYLGTCSSEHDFQTPNLLSEEMIKCISVIFCKLADPPLKNSDYRSSPISFSSSINELSTQDRDDIWSPESRKYASFNSNLGNPFCIEGSKEFSGPYCSMVEVQWVCRDSKKLRETEPMMQRFRSLVSRLEEVDPRKMKREEKLAFWINVHNALVMHAFLVYGIPQNNFKRMSLVLKAAYNVGGQTISVDMIHKSILGCRLPRPGQWMRLFFSSKMKFKLGDPRRLYAIQHPEPLIHFALSSGSFSDPPIRIYTSKRVFQELEAAKEEYIEMNLRVHKEQKILMPKIVESFAKESDLCSDGLVKMIEHFMPNYLRKRIKQFQPGKFSKNIEWVPHNFSFRYLLLRDLAN